MNKFIVATVLALFTIVVSCKKSGTINGISKYETINSVSDFAPELWMKDNTFKGSFSDDYKIFFFFRKLAHGVEKYIPYKSNYVNGKWEEPEIMDFYDQKNSYTYQVNVPKKNKLIFLSNKRTRKDTSQNPNYNFWEVELIDGKCGEPIELAYENLTRNYNSQPCITENGTIYFTSNPPDWSKTFSYKMELKDEKFLEPELFEPVNSWRNIKDWEVYEFCVSPDEKFLIVSIGSKNGEVSSVDLYISFFKDSNWTLPKKLSDEINSIETENFPTITHDGKYLIFTRAFSEFKIVPTSLFK